MEEQPELRDAVMLGFRRASLHWIQAGYELVAGLSAFLDEVAKVHHEEQSHQAGESGSDDEGLTRIELE